MGAFSPRVMQNEKPNAQPPDEFVNDPLDTRQADVEKDDVKNFLTDQRYAINLFGDGLSYYSKRFAEDTELTGFLRLSACISLDVPDTDFWVRVYEIKLDGTSIFLAEDFLRARYRESLTTPKPVRPGQIERYAFNNFYFFSRRIAKGSVLRLVIRSPNSVYWQKNYNSGKQVVEESAADAKTAHVKLYHDPKHPSFLEISRVKSINFVA